MTTIHCTLTAPAATEPTTVAEVRVELLDATDSDAPAGLVARRTLSDVSLGPGAEDLYVGLDADLDPARDYVVRAVADRAGTGSLAPGDWTTTTREPVSEDRTDVRLVLHPVTG